jgi:hypothetical protein
MGSIKIYDPDSENRDTIEAQLGPGYDVLYDDLKSEYDTEEEAREDLCKVIEATLIQQIQNTETGSELHHLTAAILNSLEEENMLNIDAMVEESIHQLVQVSES